MRRGVEKKGIVLILALIVMVVLATVALGYAYVVNRSQVLLNSQNNDARAFYLAEGGLNKAVWYLTNTAPDGSTDGSWRTSSYPTDAGADPSDPQEESLGPGRYTIWVEDAGGNVMVTARGEINNMSRTLRQEFSSVSPPGVVEDSWREI